MSLQIPMAVARLRASAAAIEQLVAEVPAEQARWRPRPEKWSLLEVINHLADEEKEDFRTRLDLLLHHPGQSWPGIDPEGWVSARRYDERDLPQSLQRFLQERQTSLAWLEKLGTQDWTTSYEHPRAGRLTASSLLASWVAHDLLHLRQLTRLHYEYLALQAQPHSVAYAGTW